MWMRVLWRHRVLRARGVRRAVAGVGLLRVAAGRGKVRTCVGVYLALSVSVLVIPVSTSACGHPRGWGTRMVGGWGPGVLVGGGVAVRAGAGAVGVALRRWGRMRLHVVC
ncbi:hypothetical protein DFH07DRAFT_839046 [Mycena maculata]|uniref:Uncharacterized protein n=1 Tax=Mycena maculata TaxID=230809 RepID=A0AAD7IDA9_9AGAR|nr:hypothetical protein DFH07DRAFT_839046 [Mycena maculata]